MTIAPLRRGVRAVASFSQALTPAKPGITAKKLITSRMNAESYKKRKKRNAMKHRLPNKNAAKFITCD